MPRSFGTKLLPLALVLALGAAACAETSQPGVDVGSGLRFLPEVADPLNDAGRFGSVVTTEAGLPVVAYFAFQEEPEEGELVQPRPVGAPSIPGVLLATVSEQGFWTRGAIAIAAQIPNVDVAFAPAFEPSVADLTPDNVTGLRMVADGNTYHAVWGSADGVYHATGSLDPASTTQAEVSRVTTTPGLGPSIGLVGGEPWIAYQTSTSDTSRVELATPEGDGWSVVTIAEEAPGCDTCSTAVVDTDAGPAVAYSTGGSGVWVATNDGEGGWSSFELAAEGGQGLAGASVDGVLGLSFYGPDQVAFGSGAPGSFQSEAVAEVAEGSPTDPGAGTGLTVGSDGSVTIAWHDADTGVPIMTGEPGAFEPIDAADATTDGAFPSAASAEGGVFVSWYDATEQDLLVGGYGEFGEVGFAVPSPTPTGAVQPPAPPSTDECTPVENGEITVVASGITFTDGKCIEATTGEPFTIHFDNQDEATQHNVQIYGDAEPTGDLLMEGAIITGPAQTDYEVPAFEQAGDYAYICVIHPDQMVGTVQVVAGGGGGGGGDGGGGGGGGTTVTASGTAFDTSEISLTAGEPSTITFVNDDAGIQHNIAIYPSPDDLADFLFRGELITGPDEVEYAIDPLEAGEYYFQCDVHPDMNGTVTVS